MKLKKKHYNFLIKWIYNWEIIVEHLFNKSVNICKIKTGLVIVVPNDDF